MYGFYFLEKIRKNVDFFFFVLVEMIAAIRYTYSVFLTGSKKMCILGTGNFGTARFIFFITTMIYSFVKLLCIINDG